MCTVSALNEITSRVVQAAKDGLGDKLHKVILYGSYARGDQDDESDIDIMVLADIPMEETNDAYDKISALLPYFSLEYDVLVSIHVTSKATFYKYLKVLPFYQNVLKDGRVLCAFYVISKAETAAQIENAKTFLAAVDAYIKTL